MGEKIKRGVLNMIEDQNKKSKMVKHEIWKVKPNEYLEDKDTVFLNPTKTVLAPKGKYEKGDEIIEINGQIIGFYKKKNGERPIPDRIKEAKEKGASTAQVKYCNGIPTYY